MWYKIHNKILFVFCLFIFIKSINAQNYHGLNGSAYFGVSNIYVNPASSVNSFYKWDVTLFGMQFNTSQNTGFLKNASLLDVSKLGDSTAKVYNGNASRYYHGILDGQGLSFRYKIDEDKAFAVSLRARSYNHFKSNNLFYTDSIKKLNQFLSDNIAFPKLDFFFNTSSWFETNINYSQIIFKNIDTRLSVGANLTFIKALAGGHFALKNVNFNKNIVSSSTFYRMIDGSMEYMYSKNLSIFDTAKFTANTFKQYYQSSLNTIGLSFGIEYLLNDEDAIENISTTNYKWKIGASIMDIGYTNYEYAKGSAYHDNPNIIFTDTILDTKFKNVKNLRKFRDSMSTLFDFTDSLEGNFSIGLPTRIVLNADRKITDNFYINASATINFFSTSSKTRINTRELNMFTLTPRIETQLFGFYLPIQYNTQADFLIGAALKLGPLIVGIHDISVLNCFSKQNQTLKSGGYFMLNIYPYKSRKTIDGELKCPPK